MHSGTFLPRRTIFENRRHVAWGEVALSLFAASIPALSATRYGFRDPFYRTGWK